MSKNNVNKNFSNMAIRTLTFEPSSVDLTKRTVDLCVSTGEKILRNSWFENPVYEQLEISERAIDLKRFKRKAPLLIDHNIYYLGSQVGVVERAWVQNDEFWVTVRFSKRSAADDIFKDVADGIIANVSFGYTVNEYRKFKNEGDKYETILATSITPYEVSLVTVGADSGAGVRSIDDNYIPNCILEEREKMFAKIKSNRNRLLSSEPEATTPEINTEPENKSNLNENNQLNEQKRIISIMDFCTKRNISNDEMQKIIKETRTFEEAKLKIADIIFNRDDEKNKQRVIDNNFNEFESKNKNQRHSPISSTGQDELLLIRSGIENAISHRVGADELTENGKRFRSLSLIEICREFLPNCKEKTLSKSEIAKRALSTSDFSSLMLNVANKRIRKAYEAMPQTFKPLVRKASLSDFKPTTVIQTGIAPELKKVPEHGKYEETKFSDTNESYQLETFGRILSVTRQMIINDDLNALNMFPTAFGRAAANLESKVVYDQLINNKILMSDKKPLFHVDHKNIAKQKAKISKESLEIAENIILSQTGLENEIINLRAKYLIVPNALKNVAKIAMSDVIANKVEDINPYANAFEIIVEPMLDSYSKTGWYLVADPNLIDLIEIGYLNGEEGVKLTKEEKFESDVVRFKASLDFGAKAIDWRGFYYNEGV